MLSLPLKFIYVISRMLQFILDVALIIHNHDTPYKRGIFVYPFEPPNGHSWSIQCHNIFRINNHFHP